MISISDKAVVETQVTMDVQSGKSNTSTMAIATIRSRRIAQNKVKVAVKQAEQ